MDVPGEFTIREGQKKLFCRSLPVKDEYLSTLLSKIGLTDSRCDADVVEQAKAHCFVHLCVMARRTDYGNGISDLTVHHSPTSLDSATRRKF